MSTEPNSTQTRAAYENPQVVAGYMAEHAVHPKMLKAAEAFAQTLPGKRIIDVGCGPGHDSWHFAKLGFEVTGIDLSLEMIKAAKGLGEVDNAPNFLVGDMTKLGKLFADGSFDGAWVCASLLHIPRKLVPKVLSGLKRTVVNGGKIYIGVKKGDGERLLAEEKYGMPMERLFVYWQSDDFRQVCEQAGLEVIRVEEQVGKETTWLNFYLENKK